MSEPFQILVFGRQGRLLFAGTLEEVTREDERIRKEGRGFPHMTQITEVSFGNLITPESVLIPEGDPASGYQFLKQWLEPLYQRYGRYGDFGDLLSVICVSGMYVLTSIAVKGFHKPGVATDIVPILIDSAGKEFLVAIIRGQPPGQGKLATIGGFNEIHEYHFASSAECFRAEALEESGLCIEINHDISGDTPFPDTVQTCVDVLGERYNARAYCVGIYYTGPEECNRTLGQKRVHVTAGYVLPVRLNTEFSRAEIEDHLIPKDKAEGTKVRVLQIGSDQIDFALSHHGKIFSAAVEKVKYLMRRNIL